VGLSEIVSPYVLFGLPDLAKSMEAAKKMNKSLQGHAPVTYGKDLSAYLASGVTTDHEAMKTEEALDRVRNGCYLLMRESPVARNMAECVKAVTKHKVDPSMISVVTDDTHAVELVEEGHMDLKAGGLQLVFVLLDNCFKFCYFFSKEQQFFFMLIGNCFPVVFMVFCDVFFVTL